MKEIKFLHHDRFEQTILGKRLIWISEGPGADTKAEKNEKPIEVKDKMEAAELDQVVERVKTMTLKEKNVQIDPAGKNIDALNFKKALDKVIQNEKMEETVKVNKLGNFLVYGLMERITGKAPDKIGGSMGGNELSKWLKENKIAAFTIEDGNWLFFDKDKKPVQATYKLDAPVDGGKKAEIKTEKKDKVGVSKGVDLAKKKDQLDSAKKAEDASKEADRVKPENLEKAKSEKPVPLNDIKTMDELATKLEASVTKDGVAAVKKSEIQTALLDYIKASNIAGDNDEQRFTNFFDKIKKSYLAATIEGGKIGFIRVKDGTVDTNPSNLTTIVDGKPKSTELYVSEALKQKIEGKAAEADKKAKIDSEPKPTKYDATELAVQKLLLGKEKPAEGEKMPEVNARYLAAYEAIVKFDGNGVDFDLAFNDSPMKCRFYETKDGAYKIKYGPSEKQYASFRPEAGSKEPLKDAQVYFLKMLNSGEFLQKIQSYNIANKGYITDFKQVIDDGPKQLAANKVQYEFDWDKGWDPDIVIEALPHGELAVTIKKSGIAPDGGNQYDFKAGSFQDMMRQIKAIQNQVEHPERYTSEDKEMMNFLRKGKDFLQSIAAGGSGEGTWDAGKILNVRSVESNDEVLSANGVYVEFDWLSKLQPPRKLQVIGKFGKYEYLVAPGDFKLPINEAPQNGGFQKAMKALSEWKSQETQKGGAEVVKQKTNALIEKYNKSVKEAINTKGFKAEILKEVELRKSVIVTAVIGDMVYLSMGEGMAAKGFDFGKTDSTDPLKVPGIESAVREGYLVEGISMAGADKKVDGDKKAPDKPVDRVSAGLEKGKENPAIVDRAEKEAALADLFKGVKNAQSREMLKASLLARMQGMTCDKTDKSEKTKYYKQKATEFYVGDSGKTVEQKIAETNAKKPEEMMAKSSKELFGEKYLPDLPNTRGVLISLVYRMADIARGDASIDVAKVDQIKQTYAEAIKETTAQIMSENKQNKGETKVGYDKRVMELVLKQVKMPEVYLAEYQSNEAKRSSYAEYQKSAPPEKPIDKVSVKTEKEKTPNDFAEKKEAVEKVCAKVTDAVTRGKLDSYLKARLVDEKTPVNGTALPKDHYQMRAWEILRDLVGEKGEYYEKGVENKDLQKRVLAKLNGKKEAGTLFDKVDSYSDNKTFLAEQPRTKAYLNGLLENFDKDAGVTDATKLKELKTAYKEGLSAIANEYIAAKPFPTKKGQLKTDYDLAMLKAISWKIKAPADFAKDYQENLDQKDKYKVYTEKAAKLKKGQEEFEAGKKDPNSMSFAEFEKSKMAGAAPEAWRMFNDTKVLSKENVFLSRIENNNSSSDPISFNIKVGPPNQLKPFTLTVLKSGNGVILTLAEGWNNRVYSYKEEHKNINVAEPISKDRDPIKSILAGPFGISAKTTDRMEKWLQKDESKKAETPVKAVPEQKADGKKVEDKKPDDKKPEDKKPEDKKAEAKKAA